METLEIGISFSSSVTSPHSLGTLIEWKLIINKKKRINRLTGPHSLGTLIEWKLKTNSV